MDLRLGAYTACLHDRSLDDALAVISSLGLTGAEVNAGGFLPSPHLPVQAILRTDSGAVDYLARFAAAGVELTALNCNGNPLHPDAEVRDKHAADLHTTLELAARLGVPRVVTMSGLPAAHTGGTLPSWTVLPWDSAYLDARDYQWNDVAVPFWKEVEAHARDVDVHVCVEMHPHMLVYNPATMQRLATEIDATHVGAELDPSHLFWQGIDPVAAVRSLGDLVRNAAAKDTRINAAASINGVLDDRFSRVHPAQPGAVGLGGRYTVSGWPDDASWDFVAVGRGHDSAFWTELLRALSEIDPAMAVSIEHEDRELGQIEGLELAATTLLKAAADV